MLSSMEMEEEIQDKFRDLQKVAARIREIATYLIQTERVEGAPNNDPYRSYAISYEPYEENSPAFQTALDRVESNKTLVILTLIQPGAEFPIRFMIKRTDERGERTHFPYRTTPHHPQDEAIPLHSQNSIPTQGVAAPQHMQERPVFNPDEEPELDCHGEAFKWPRNNIGLATQKTLVQFLRDESYSQRLQNLSRSRKKRMEELQILAKKYPNIMIDHLKTYAKDLAPLLEKHPEELRTLSKKNLAQLYSLFSVEEQSSPAPQGSPPPYSPAPQQQPIRTIQIPPQGNLLSPRESPPPFGGLAASDVSSIISQLSTSPGNPGPSTAAQRHSPPRLGSSSDFFQPLSPNAAAAPPRTSSSPAPILTEQTPLLGSPSSMPGMIQNASLASFAADLWGPRAPRRPPPSAAATASRSDSLWLPHF